MMNGDAISYYEGTNYYLQVRGEVAAASRKAAEQLSGGHQHHQQVAGVSDAGVYFAYQNQTHTAIAQ